MYKTEIEYLSSELEKKNIILSEDAKHKFNKFCEILIEYNKTVNLTAICEPYEVMIKHFYDSLSPAFFNLIKGDERIIDIGCGAGFPSIPLKILLPKLKMTLIDSNNKKLTFVRHLINELGLTDIETFHIRAEEAAKTQRESFDICVSRAVANMSVLCELCLPFVKVGGSFIAYKGSAVYEELDLAKNALKILGGKLKEFKEVPLPLKDKSEAEQIFNLAIIGKTSPTNPLYPRTSAKIKSNPL